MSKLRPFSMAFHKLSDLKRGEKAIITGFTNNQLSIRLMEMGCLPGEEVKLKYSAPLGDPVAIQVCGYLLSLRKSEAETIVISACF
jgi:ferrous iron transport protein A